MKFLALTHPTDKTTVFINADHIDEISPAQHQEGSLLILQSGRTRRVLETPLLVAGFLNAAWVRETPRHDPIEPPDGPWPPPGI